VTEHVSVLLVGVDPAGDVALARDGGFAVRLADDIAAAGTIDEDAIVLALGGTRPLDALRAARAAAPDAAIVVVTDADHAADGAIGVHAGAEDHLVLDDLFAHLLPRAVRYAVAIRQVRSELSTVDQATELPNLRGFAPIAEHHLRMADRTEHPVVFVFIRLDDHARLHDEEGHERAEALAKEAADVVLEAVRDADVPARIAPDTIAVLLTGEAAGAETVVLSRLVEAIALQDARRADPRALALSVGTARYEPKSGAGLAEILSSAMRGLAGRG
jgi:diguanylate cyclase (GGDEF)-like protein